MTYLFKLTLDNGCENYSVTAKAKHDSAAAWGLIGDYIKKTAIRKQFKVVLKVELISQA